MKTILCYGDSNTFGWKPVRFDPKETPIILGQYRLPFDKRWTGVMAGKLGKDYHIIEEGLGGRTTVWDDPIEGEHRNGKKYLLPCLESHTPIDLVVLMLGTNDLKMKFSVTAYDITMGVAVLIGIIQGSATGRDGKAPKILVMSPPPLGELTDFEEMFIGGADKSKKLAEYYQTVSRQFGCDFFDTGKIISSSPVDGVHFEEEEHLELGKAVAEKVRKII